MNWLFYDMNFIVESVIIVDLMENRFIRVEKYGNIWYADIQVWIYLKGTFRMLRFQKI